MLQLYTSLIGCKLEYCCPVWDPSAVSDIRLIEDVQRKFTSKIIGCKELTYWDRLKFLGLQSLQRRRERYAIIHVWKIINNLAPNDMKMKFHDDGRTGVRAKIPPMVRGAPTAAQTARDKSFTVRAAKLWNILPANITRTEKLESFKTQLGHFLAAFPDNPPVAGYTVANDNSLLSWSQEGTRWTAHAS